jgi:hypothetical protein
MSVEGNEGKGPDRRSPCAVQVARTVTTGGMGRRTFRHRALSLPTALGSQSLVGYVAVVGDLLSGAHLACVSWTGETDGMGCLGTPQQECRV